MRPKNWADFQHYKNRRPPWIRLYHSLLDKSAFWSLRGEDAKYLVLIWLIASEHENGDLPPLADLAFRFRLPVKKAQQVLSRLQAWLEDDASYMLADRKQVATPEKRRGRGEAETEGEAGASARPPLVSSGPDKPTGKGTGFPFGALESPSPGPPAPKPSPGANGEFMAATGLLQDLEIPATAGDIRIVAQLLQFEAKHHGGVEEACAYVRQCVGEARIRGEPVTVFWLKDGKYNHRGRSANERENPNVRALREFIAELGDSDHVSGVGAGGKAG